MSPKYSLNKEDAFKILEVIFWSVSSTVIAVLITALSQLDVPAEYMFLVPFANAILYTIKRYVDGQK